MVTAQIVMGILSAVWFFITAALNGNLGINLKRKITFFSFDKDASTKIIELIRSYRYGDSTVSFKDGCILTFRKKDSRNVNLYVGRDLKRYGLLDYEYEGYSINNEAYNMLVEFVEEIKEASNGND